MHLYKNCRDISIFNFDMIYRTNDFRYLVVGFNGYDDIEVPKEAEERWAEIFNQWLDLLESADLRYYYDLMFEVNYLETRFIVARELLFQIYTRMGSMADEVLDKYIVELKNWRYKFKKDNGILKEVHRLMLFHKGSANEISLKRSELESMSKTSKSKEETLESQAVILERVTGIKIDIRTTSVLTWEENKKLANRINKEKAKNGK